MSWKHRSDEEKQRIFDEQKAQKKQSKEYLKSDENALEIYKNGEIPIKCPKCLCWGGSDEYKVIKETPFFGGDKLNFIKGSCRRCKTQMSRVFPHLISNEGMLFGAVFGRLMDNGRLKDLRKVETTFKNVRKEKV